MTSFSRISCGVHKWFCGPPQDYLNSFVNCGSSPNGIVEIKAPQLQIMEIVELSRTDLLARRGLGKNEAGIAKPVKCSLKFNKSGIGYDKKVSEEETNRWWIEMYNKAASSAFSSKTKTDEISKQDKDEKYKFSELTDEELFAACGGRTAHKAARHGLKLSGKLQRIENQEKLIGSGSSISEVSKNTTEIQIAGKKTKKRKIDELTKPSPCDGNHAIETSDTVSKKKKNRKTESTNFVPKLQDKEIPNNDTLSTSKKKKTNSELHTK